MEELLTATSNAGLIMLISLFVAGCMGVTVLFLDWKSATQHWKKDLKK